MKISNFNLFCGFFISFFLGIIIPISAQCLPSLGTTSGFAIYTSSGAVTNVTQATIVGDIGSNVGVISGFESSIITGNFHNADSVTQSAALDLASASVAFQILTPTITSHTPTYGSGETLFPGVYNIGAAGSIAGILTLDGQNNPNAKFILKFAGAFTSGAGAAVALINGALPNNIYWIVGGAFSLAANTTFKGTIIADGAISVGVGAHLNCKLLSTGGAISIYGSVLSNDGIDNSSSKYYADIDTDGYGDPNTSSCYFVSGYVLNNTDCNDGDETIHPNAIEIFGNGIDDDCDGIIDTDAVRCPYTTTWNGSSWSNGSPDTTKSVIFTGNYTIAADFNACSILVTNNAVVTVDSYIIVYLYGAVTVNTGSNFILNNDTHLLQEDATAVNVGNVVVKQNTSDIIRLDHTLWSSPVTGQNLYQFSPATLTYRFYTYDTFSNQYLSSTLNSNSEFSPTKGYAIRAPNNQSATVPSKWLGTFTGVLNNGTISSALVSGVANNYNLLGNPYPSAIDADTFITANSETIDGTLYFYQHSLIMYSNGLFPTGTNYASMNITGGTPATEADQSHPAFPISQIAPNGIIGVGQGFFVKAKNSGVVNFTNSMRVTDELHQFHRITSTTSEKHRMWLNLKSNTGSDINQILVGYLEGATQGVDSKYDGLSYGNSGSYLYSIIDGGQYVIQGKALPVSLNDEVSLGFKCAETGTYSIKLTDMDGLFLGNQDIFIRDNLMGTDTNIKTAPYTFSSELGVFDNRFKIVYTQALGVSSSNFNENSVIVYKNIDWFHISTKGIVLKDILVYNVSGRLIYKSNNIKDTTSVLKGLPQANQVLFIKLISQENQSVTIKVIN